MAPCIRYPITKELFTPVVNLAHLKSNLPMLDSPPTLELESKPRSPSLHSTLECLKSNPVDNYLKSVLRLLREPFEIIMELNLTMTLRTPEGIPFFEWSITFRKILKKGNYMLLEVLGVLNEGLYQCQTLLKNIRKLDETEIDHLKKLKKELFMLAGYLDNILMFYSNGGRKQDVPVVKKIKRVAKKCREYLRNLKPAMLLRLIPNMVSVKEEDILGLVLGLKDSVTDRLSKLNPDVRGHQTDMYFILHFLEEDSKYLGSLTNETDVSAKLQEMGFTENRSDVVAKWICEQSYPEHQQLYSWIQDYIEKLFLYDIFLNDVVANYPFHKNKIDEWFTVVAEHYDDDEYDDEENPVKTNVPIINTTVEKVVMVVKEQQQKYKNEGKCLYFHGTDHDGAKRILEDGINLGASKRHCELSDGYGFYLSTDSEFSINWSKKHDASAIVVFDIEDSLSKFQPLDLTVEERRSDLKNLEKHCRFDERLSNPLKQWYKTCDYVKAPLSQAPGHHHQLCIKKEAMADVIGDSQKINSVIFVNRIKKPKAFTKPRKKIVVDSKCHLQNSPPEF